MKTKLFVLLIVAAFASEKYKNAENGPNSAEKIEIKTTENSIVVKIEESEYFKKPTSEYFGVTYNKRDSKWCAERWSRNEKKYIFNGRYDNEGKAAHASDTSARQLMEKGEQNHKLNFPDENTEVHPEKKPTASEYIGVTYNQKNSNWRAKRWSRKEKKLVSNGNFDNEETAAHASDTLARKLMENGGEHGHRLNFPDDDTEMHPKKATSEYIGVAYGHRDSIWCVSRWSKNEKKVVYNGYFDNEEKAAHASDTLARKLMANGEQDHKLNFPDDDTEVYTEYQKNKRKRKDNFQDN